MCIYTSQNQCHILVDSFLPSSNLEEKINKQKSSFQEKNRKFIDNHH
jgi:hypothetical protein